MNLKELENIIQHEPQFRVTAFLSILVLMGTWEMISPRRPLSIKKKYRWMNNLGIVVLSSILVRIIFPMSAVGVALLAEEKSWGLFSVLNLPDWGLILLSIVILDFAVWAQHVMFHAIPSLWRVHRMHHADLDFDLTTGLRFHPIEIFLSIGIKAGVIIAFGMPAVAVLFFEVILNTLAMFNHANARLPLGVDKILRLFVVTPDMHRVHHSWHKDETNSNFGFNLSCWDRLLGTYKAQPRDGHDGMTIGMHQFREPSWLRIDKMLVQPFMGKEKVRFMNQTSGPISEEKRRQ